MTPKELADFYAEAAKPGAEIKFRYANDTPWRDSSCGPDLMCAQDHWRISYGEVRTVYIYYRKLTDSFFALEFPFPPGSNPDFILMQELTLEVPQ